MDELSGTEARRVAVAAAGLASWGRRRGPVGGAAGGGSGGVAAAGGAVSGGAVSGGAAGPPSWVPGAGTSPRDVAGVLRALGAVQLDTISVLARSQSLVPFARLGAVGEDAVAGAYWAEPPAAFEYWAHAACVLPLESWPLFESRRRYFRRRYGTSRPDLAPAREAVLAALRERGPLTATDLGGAKRGGVWWDWSDSKIAVEELLGFGDVVCTRRVGWRRVYDLPERAVPPDVLARVPSDEECQAALVRFSGDALGVATAGDLADYFRCCSVAEARRLAPEVGLVPVAVRGWGQSAWASPAWLAAMDAVPKASRTTLLTPFDPLVWTRDRAERVFGMRHRLEAYTPAPKREHGYYAMPVLAGGRLVGRVDPARKGATLVAKHVTFAGTAEEAGPTGATLRAVAAALRKAASWVGASAVAVERVTPNDAAPALVREVSAAVR